MLASFSAYLEGVASRTAGLRLSYRFVFPTPPFSPLSDKNGYQLYHGFCRLAACPSGITPFHNYFYVVIEWVTVTSEPDWTQAAKEERLHSSVPFLPRGRPAPTLA